MTPASRAWLNDIDHPMHREFVTIGLLGEGAYGVVRKAKRRHAHVARAACTGAAADDSAARDVVNTARAPIASAASSSQPAAAAAAAVTVASAAAPDFVAIKEIDTSDRIDGIPQDAYREMSVSAE